MTTADDEANTSIEPNTSVPAPTGTASVGLQRRSTLEPTGEPVASWVRWLLVLLPLAVIVTAGGLLLSRVQETLDDGLAWPQFELPDVELPEWELPEWDLPWDTSQPSSPPSDPASEPEAPTQAVTLPDAPTPPPATDRAPPPMPPVFDRKPPPVPPKADKPERREPPAKTVTWPSQVHVPMPADTADGAPAVPAPEPRAEASAAVPFDPARVVQKLASADLQQGERWFRICGVCHTADADAGHKVGPNLWGISGRGKASLDGFHYSQALRDQGGTWTDQELAAYLHEPRRHTPGTSMTFAGIKNEDRLASIIAYLRTLR